MTPACVAEGGGGGGGYSHMEEMVVLFGNFEFPIWAWPMLMQIPKRDFVYMNRVNIMRSSEFFLFCYFFACNPKRDLDIFAQNDDRMTFCPEHPKRDQNPKFREPPTLPGMCCKSKLLVFRVSLIEHEDNTVTNGSFNKLMNSNCHRNLNFLNLY